MSRIGKLPITISENVEVVLDWNKITTKWKLWVLNFQFSELIEISKEENILVFKPKNEEASALWWTTRAIVANMIEWVSVWYKKALEINWVWYKFDVVSDKKLILSVWFSHKVEMEAPEGIKITVDEKLKNVIYISWIDKQLVWQFASKIKAKKKPEPYKWKWIKYVGEIIRRKAWKTGK
jgi:large subunit ribosomal protein L6